MTRQPDNEAPQLHSLLCQCGHAARAHGPRLGEDFHKRCWYCQCPWFHGEDRELMMLGTKELAEELRVSESWVRDHALKLGGWKQDYKWRFARGYAIEWGVRLRDSVGNPTIYFVCSECEGRTLVTRGRIGYVEVPIPHIEGMCWGEVAGDREAS